MAVSLTNTTRSADNDGDATIRSARMNRFSISLCFSATAGPASTFLCCGHEACLRLIHTTHIIVVVSHQSLCHSEIAVDVVGFVSFGVVLNYSELIKPNTGASLNRQMCSFVQ